MNCRTTSRSSILDSTEVMDIGRYSEDTVGFGIFGHGIITARLLSSGVVKMLTWFELWTHLFLFLNIAWHAPACFATHKRQFTFEPNTSNSSHLLCLETIEQGLLLSVVIVAFKCWASNLTEHTSCQKTNRAGLSLSVVIVAFNSWTWYASDHPCRRPRFSHHPIPTVVSTRHAYSSFGSIVFSDHYHLELSGQKSRIASDDPRRWPRGCYRPIPTVLSPPSIPPTSTPTVIISCDRTTKDLGWFFLGNNRFVVVCIFNNDLKMCIDQCVDTIYSMKKGIGSGGKIPSTPPRYFEHCGHKVYPTCMHTYFIYYNVYIL